jgi:hypothetical protein
MDKQTQHSYAAKSNSIIRRLYQATGQHISDADIQHALNRLPDQLDRFKVWLRDNPSAEEHFLAGTSPHASAIKQAIAHSEGGSWADVVEAMSKVRARRDIAEEVFATMAMPAELRTGEENEFIAEVLASDDAELIEIIDDFELRALAAKALTELSADERHRLDVWSQGDDCEHHAWRRKVKDERDAKYKTSKG